jgi:glycosyltransferase involved in cell wall biosynthesis
MTFGTLHAPLVSVIVINYNYGRFIEECLKSIADQTYPYIDCVVFDNGSTDNSKDIIQSAVQGKLFTGDGRSLNVVMWEANILQTPAAVEAFKYAKGSFIIFFDADDFMLPTCIEAHIRAMLYLRTPVGATCVDYFMSRNDQVVTSTGSVGFSRTVSDGDGLAKPLCRIVEIPKTSQNEPELDLQLSELHLVPRTARGWPWTGTCGLCFRRELIEILFRRPPELKAQLDAYLIGGVNVLTGSVLIDRPLVIYRHHGSNIFAQHPTITNFRFYDVRIEREASSLAVQEIIKSLLYCAGELANRLDWSGTFIEAIETLSGMWSSAEPSMSQTKVFMCNFLKDNKGVLTKAFGAQEYRRWQIKYASKKSALMRLSGH